MARAAGRSWPIGEWRLRSDDERKAAVHRTGPGRQHSTHARRSRVHPESLKAAISIAFRMKRRRADRSIADRLREHGTGLVDRYQHQDLRRSHPGPGGWRTPHRGPGCSSPDRDRAAPRLGVRGTAPRPRRGRSGAWFRPARPLGDDAAERSTTTSTSPEREAGLDPRSASRQATARRLAPGLVGGLELRARVHQSVLGEVAPVLPQIAPDAEDTLERLAHDPR